MGSPQGLLPDVANLGDIIDTFFLAPLRASCMLKEMDWVRNEAVYYAGSVR